MPSAPARLLLLVLLAGALWTAWRFGWRGHDDALVVYCAHDAEYADLVFSAFTRSTGIAVRVRYDSEATKSLGLVERLIAEDGRGPCDVFWNNEQLGSMDLATRGLLTPYQGPGWQALPPAWRDRGGRWSAFAARLRVMIVNTERMPATASAVRERLAGDLARVAIAKPLFGTTLTHYSSWWAVYGGERLATWHRDSRARGLREVDGNGMVKALVASGACDLGFTDTDDFFAARDAGAPVAMLPAHLGDLTADGGGQVILIPNTVALVRGGTHRAQGERLVDFLLSPAGELLLARSPSRQIPLGAVRGEDLPGEVRDLRAAAEGWVQPTDLALARAQCLDWLRRGAP